MQIDQHIRVIVPDGVVVIDGTSYPVQLDLPGVWAAWWDVDSGRGEIEYSDSSPNETIDSLGWFDGARQAVDDYLATIPPSPLHVADGRGGWQLDLEKMKEQKVKEISAACVVDIEVGFESNALGAPHFYPSKRGDDQINLVGAVATGQDISFPCRDAAGSWQRRQHTATQIAQVLADGALLKQQYLERYDTRIAAINAAETAEALGFIVW